MTTISEPLVEYLASTRIGEKGQLTVPKEYRDAVGLEAGSPVAVLRVGDGLILMPEQTRFDELCNSIASALESGGIIEPRLQSTLPEARRRVFARRYPKLVSNKASSRKVKKR
jgi:AbrB family looped-hinge helix DNA binding protein